MHKRRLDLFKSNTAVLIFMYRQRMLKKIYEIQVKNEMLFHSPIAIGG